MFQEAHGSAQQLLQAPGVEADDDFAVHQRHRRGQQAELFELGQRRRVLRDVALGELNLLLGKKLFHLVAEESPWLDVDGDAGRAHSAFFSFSSTCGHSAAKCSRVLTMVEPTMTGSEGALSQVASRS